MKASGLGKDAYIGGPLNTHAKSLLPIEQIKKSRFYQEYPCRGVPNIGDIDGSFESLWVFYGMVFDKRVVFHLSAWLMRRIYVFVWSKQTIEELKKKNGNLQNNQRVAISYLWEVCDDRMLAREYNLFQSLSCVGFGLKVDN